MIGSIPTGGNHPVRIQSMTNTPTHNIVSTVDQAIRLFDAGADFVRIAVPDQKSIGSLREIRQKLRKCGYDKPLIADVHFNPKLALLSAPFSEKIRINPGNYTGAKRAVLPGDPMAHERERDQIRKNLNPLVETCRQYGTAIRIGANMGSISPLTIQKFGHGPSALVESALMYLEIINDLGYEQCVVSLKTSKVETTLEANELMAKRMQETNSLFPLHLGITEAGWGLPGRIKSAVGIGSLLRQGIGDTIRVSLTEPPENEIPVCREIIRICNQFLKDNPIMPVGEPNEMLTNKESGLIMAAIRYGLPLLKGQISEDGLKEDLKNATGLQENAVAVILQACGIKFSNTELIACPSCARTSYDIESVARETSRVAGDFPGLKVAVMGCVVNGPGEMADADYGLLGSGRDMVDIYQGRQCICKGVAAHEAPELLRKLIVSHSQVKPG